MATSKLYDVNFKRLALLLLPTFWRRPLFAAMAYAAVSPLQYLHTRSSSGSARATTASNTTARCATCGRC